MQTLRYTLGQFIVANPPTGMLLGGTSRSQSKLIWTWDNLDMGYSPQSSGSKQESRSYVIALRVWGLLKLIYNIFAYNHMLSPQNKSLGYSFHTDSHRNALNPNIKVY